jgi:hypothetical protein
MCVAFTSSTIAPVGWRAAVLASLLPHQVVQEVDLVTRRRAFGRRNNCHPVDVLLEVPRVEDEQVELPMSLHDGQGRVAR